MAQFRKDTHQYLPDGKTIFETVMLADRYGNLVGAANPTGMAIDAFGRARISQPLTLFDSFHRYQDNGKISTANSATGTYTYNPNNSIVSITVDTTSDAYVKRESARVFAYQPGKSLLILQTYIMNPPKENLRQRYGYFGEENGVFFQIENEELSFVIRSSSTGSLVENKVTRSNWNIDKLDGTGPSQLTLDITKAQIQFIDIEWLGLGTVRVGFVINGQFIHCHSFHHSNIITNTYMTTGCLPVRAEIENIGTTESSSTLQIICASVISEGGYELKGRSRGIIMPLSTPKDIPTAGTFVPLISIRLKDARSDAIVIPTNIEFFGLTNNTKYIYKVVTGATLANASWVSAGTDSSIEYDVSATALTGGIDRQQGYVNISAGAGGESIQLDSDQLFSFQLERNSFLANNKGFAFTLAATGAANGDDAVGGITWEEIT